MQIEIRKEREDEYFKTEAMVRRSFYNIYRPGCDEHLLVNKLRTHPDYLPELSRVAVVDGEIAGTIMYFKATVHAKDRDITVLSFGPLSVDHRYKNMGIGGRLIRETIELAREAGYPGIVIMGEPDYYPKMGFRRARDFGLTDMEGNAPDPFMAYELYENGLHIPGGKFSESRVEELCTEEALQELEKNSGYPKLHKVAQPCQWSYNNAYDDREGYHYEYATHCPKLFDSLYGQYVQENTEKKIKDIWECIDRTPYVLKKGDTPLGVMVISMENEPEVEQIYLDETKPIPKGMKEEIVERFLNANRVRN